MLHAMLGVASSSKNILAIWYHRNLFPVTYTENNVELFADAEFYDPIDREFDEGLLPSISEVHFDDELDHVPSSPDVGNYLISEVDFVKVDASD